MQCAMLQLLSKIIIRERPHVAEVIIGGDWNASLESRLGYSANPYSQTTSADSRLSDWMEINNLNLVSPKSWTWESSRNISGAQPQRACLDFFVTKENSYECTVHLSPDPAHDHRMVCIGKPHSLISPLPELPSMVKKGRLRLSAWNGARPGGRQLKEEWKESLSEALQKFDIADKAERTRVALEKALQVAEKVFGVSRPRQASHIPFHSSEAKKLLSRRRDARAAIVDLRSRLLDQSKTAATMSKALRKHGIVNGFQTDSHTQ